MKKEFDSDELKFINDLIKDLFMDINQKIDQLMANQLTPAQVASLNALSANVTTILSIVNGSTSGTSPTPGTTTAKITNLNLADASVSATGTGLFTPGTFTINGV